MPTHRDSRTLPYEAAQMFDLVADVKEYPRFLPWCVGARIRKIEEVGDKKQITADLAVRYKAFRESFSSRVTLDEQAQTITIEYLDGPFKYLENQWSFSTNEAQECVVDFFIDFEFKSRALDFLIRKKFGEAVEKMVDAFVIEADAVYGNGGD